MPPRFAYWTILIDNTPTAFRARDREELLPTMTQLKRTNEKVELKWFAQGKLWESPEAQRESWRKPKAAPERRDRDWRPGGAHKDPRARFDKEAQRRKKREERANWNAPRADASARDHERPSAPPRGDRPWGKRPWDKPRDARRGERPQWNRPQKPPSQRFDRGDEGWKPKPAGPGDQRKPWHGKPRGDRARSDRPPGNRLPGNRPPKPPSQRFEAREKGWKPKPAGPGGQRKPWHGKPRSDRPWGDRPPGNRPPGDRHQGDRRASDGERKPWAGKPPGDRPWQNKPKSPRPEHKQPNAGADERRKRRDDEAEKN